MRRIKTILVSMLILCLTPMYAFAIDPAENNTSEEAEYTVLFWTEKSDYNEKATNLRDKYEYISTKKFTGKIGSTPNLANVDIKDVPFPDLDKERLEKIYNGDTFYGDRYLFLNKFYEFNKDLTNKENLSKATKAAKTISKSGKTVYNIYFNRTVYDLYFTKWNGGGDNDPTYFHPTYIKDEKIVGEPGKPYHFKARFNQVMSGWPDDAQMTKGFEPGSNSLGYFKNTGVEGSGGNIHLDTPPYRLNADEFLDFNGYENKGGYTTKLDAGNGVVIDANTDSRYKDKPFTMISFGVQSQNNSIPHHMDFLMDGFKPGEKYFDYNLFRTKADTESYTYQHKAPKIKGFTAKYSSKLTKKYKAEEIDELNNERQKITPFPDEEVLNAWGFGVNKGEISFMNAFLNDSDEFGDPIDGLAPFKENGYIRFEYSRNKYKLRLNNDPLNVKADSEYTDGKDQLDVFYDYPLKNLNLDTTNIPEKPTWALDNFKFQGWCLDPIGKNLVKYGNEKMPDHQYVLYAKWAPDAVETIVDKKITIDKLKKLFEEDKTKEIEKITVLEEPDVSKPGLSEMQVIVEFKDGTKLGTEEVPFIVEVDTKLPLSLIEDIATKIHKDEVDLPFKTIKRETKDLEAGQTRVIKKGELGKKVITTITIGANGEPKVTEEIVKEPVDEIIEVGTKKVIPATPIEDIATKVTKTEEVIPYKTVYVANAALKYGETEVFQEGRDGKKEVITTSKVVDGKRVEDKTEKIISKATPKIISVGYRKTNIEELPYKKITQETKDLKVGETKVTQKGVVGEKKIVSVYEVDPNTGKLSNPKDTVTTKEAIDEITLIGTRIEKPWTEIENNAKRVVKEEIKVPFTTEKRETKDLEVGQTKVIQKGVEGNKIKTTTTIGDGEPTVTEETVVEMTPEIILVGTKKVIPATPIEDIAKKVTKVIEKIIAKIVYITDESLPFGEKQEKTPGQDGEKEVTITSYVKDGKRTEERTEKITKEKQDSVVKAGNKEVIKDGDKTITKIYEVDPKTGELSNPKISISVPAKTIEDIATKTTSKEVEIPYETKNKPNEDLYEGTSKVIQKGKPGKKIVTTKTVSGKEVIEEKVIEEPTPEIIAVGTKKKVEETKQTAINKPTEQTKSQSAPQTNVDDNTQIYVLLFVMSSLLAFLIGRGKKNLNK